ncbi:MAG: hypothetical protein VXX11_03705 [Planctomycetota bacterium]|nr:hypothetical protein [Planctomycetota bacterium]
MNNTTSNQLIKLAYNRPELRDAIMPRIFLAKGLAKTPEAAKNMWEKYKEKNPGTRKQPADFYEKPEEGEARKEKSDKEKSKADKGKEKNEERQKEQEDKTKKKTKGLTKKERKEFNEKVKNMTPKELQEELDEMTKLMAYEMGNPDKDPSPAEALAFAKANPRAYDQGFTYKFQAVISQQKKRNTEKSTERAKAKDGKKVQDLATKHKISPEGMKKLKTFTKKRFDKLRKDEAKGDRIEDLKDRHRKHWRENLSDEEYTEMINDYEKDGYRKSQKAKSPAELKREFMNNTDPETRKRILKMSPAEFEAMMAAIMEEEDGKQASLRTKLIRLAHAKPELRSKILPLIKQAGEFTEQEWKTYKQKHPNAEARDHVITKGDGGSKDKEKSKGKINTKPSSGHEKMQAIADIFGRGGPHNVGDTEKEKYKAVTDSEGNILSSSQARKRIQETQDIITKAIREGEGSLRERERQAWFALQEAGAITILSTGSNNATLHNHLAETENVLKKMKNDLKPGSELSKRLDSVRSEFLGSNAKKKTDKGDKGDKGDKPKKEKTKAELLKDYKDAIQKSNMSPEDKKKALEKAKKPNFDPEAALGAMGDEDEEDGGKKASLRSSLIRLAHAKPELRSKILPLLTGH